MKNSFHVIFRVFVAIFIILPAFSAFAQQALNKQLSPQNTIQTGIQPSQQPEIEKLRGQMPSYLQPSGLPAETQQGVQPLFVPLQPREEEPEAASEFEQFISGQAAPEISMDLRQFGYDLFRKPPWSFAPAGNVPVSPAYVIGPGDEIRITIWGKIEGAWNVVVDRDGNVSLPKVGILGVTGLTFSELKKLLLQEFSKYYTGFEMNVSMGSLKTNRVYVVGNARHPGSYTVSSLSTVLNAVIEAGGPTKTGTMRDIQVKRNGGAIAHFDMYDFLLKGDKTGDVRLMPDDVIFIPPSGPLAAIAGSVKNPAIYELKGPTTVTELIEMAGGLNDVAFSGRVQIERIIDQSHQTVIEASLDEIREKNVPVQPGDVVKIFQVVQDRKIVSLAGAVKRAGDYGFSPGMTVKDLLLMAGGLQYYAFSKEAELTRVDISDEGPVTKKIVINPESALAGDPENNIPLHNNDYLFVRTIPEWKLYQTVTVKDSTTPGEPDGKGFSLVERVYRSVSIEGEIRFPGMYTIEKGETLSSLIERAGGYTNKAYLRGAVFTRKRIQELQQRQLDEMIERLEREVLEKGKTEIAVAVSAEEAKIKESEIKQMGDFITKLKGVRAKGRMAIVLNEPEVLKKSLYDLELEDGDTLFIPSNPQSIQVMGAVFNQTAFIYDGSKSLSRYIDLAGGYTETADQKRVYVLKVDGTAVRPGGGFSLGSWNSDSNRWEFGSRDLEPGDTVVVPEKLEKIAWMRNIKDITQILYQIATAAGVIIVAF
jgi:polysaccharide export outer membrane protein